jgi:SAM-dependent methyltransferase
MTNPFSREDSSINPGQRARAEMEILAGILKYSSGVLREVAKSNFEATDEGKQLAEEHRHPTSAEAMKARVARAKALAESDRFYRFERFYQRIVAEEIITRPIPTAEAHRAELERIANLPRQGAGGSLELDPSLEMPGYFDVDFHLWPGSWDGYDLYGKTDPLGLPFVFKYGGYAAVPFGANIFQQRLEVIRQFPKTHYDRIYEPGCGGFGTMRALHQIFPDAELVGCELSPAQAEGTFVRAEKNGIKVHVKQRDAAIDTGEPDESFDAVITYAVHHELPVPDNIAMFKEMFRIMKPGADIILADPPPFRAVSPFHAAILDWDTDYRGEPYFSETCLADWDAELRKIGFVNVESYGLGEDSYPWVTRARKPEGGGL